MTFKKLLSFIDKKQFNMYFFEDATTGKRLCYPLNYGDEQLSEFYELEVINFCAVDCGLCVPVFLVRVR